MKILLVCSAGMSTSLLVEKMKVEGKKRGLSDLSIDAESVNDLENVIDGYDVVLVGPQVRYKEKSISEIVNRHGKKYSIIPTVTYGRIDGAKTLDIAIETIKSK